MKDKEAKELLDKYLAGQCTPNEKLLVERSYNLEIPENIQDLSLDQYAEMKAEIWNGLEQNYRPAKETHKLWPRFAAAASLILVVGAGLYFHPKRSVNTVSETAPYSNDIAPGRNTATLTLANGKKIILSDAVNGELAKESGVAISKTADGKIIYEIKETSAGVNKINTLSTANGETYQVILPDGSTVYLNAASSLKYPASFAAQKTRKVELRGEAYFEITKDKQHPFIVKTDKLEVEVLGTHFNINSYPNEPVVKTTLLEGSVKVSDNMVTKLLKPGQQSILSGSGDIRVGETDTELAVAWKNKQFMFENEKIENIMRMVERWYSVDVEYVGEITDERFGGGVSRFDNVSKVLKSLESTGKVHFKIEGRKIYVSK